jgi:hypothetical protein
MLAVKVSQIDLKCVKIGKYNKQFVENASGEGRNS